MQAKKLSIFTGVLFVIGTIILLTGTINTGKTQEVYSELKKDVVQQNEITASLQDDDWLPEGAGNNDDIYHMGNVGIGTNTPGGHKLSLESSGGTVFNSTLFAKNTHPNGIAGIFDNDSMDVTLLLEQRGQGNIFRCDSWTGGWHPVFTVQNDGRTICSILQITGGSDIAEPFSIEGKNVIEPGMVAVIDPKNSSKLKISEKAYDRCVAGIVSGAGGINPGLMLTQEDSSEGMNHVALAGRVYGFCDASYGSIEPGDLLTTSPTPGYAMKVADYERAQGAILGKAMSNLENGKGLVLILVTLQ